MDNKNETCTLTKKKLLRLIPIYLLCLILLFSYLFILFLKPDVCLEYKMYYIDDILWDWPGYNGLDYKLGETVYFGETLADHNSKRRGHGWAQRDNDYCSTNGNRVSVYFALKERTSLDIAVSVKDIYCSSYTLFVNGTPVTDKLTHQNTAFTFNVPSELVSDGLLELTFETEALQEPPSGYTGPLGVQVESIVITNAN